MPRQDVWIYRAARLPDPVEAPPKFVDVEFLNAYGDVVERVGIIYRIDPAGGIVVTGHSGARACTECGRSISPLESLVLVMPPIEWPPVRLDDPPGARAPSSEPPRLLHEVPCFRSLGRLAQ